MRKARFHLGLAVLAVAAAVAALATSALPSAPNRVEAQVACQNSPIIEWTTASGGNGHSYQLICAPGISWQNARSASEALGGHLATATSSEENDFIYNSVVYPYWTDDPGQGPFLGGYQPVPPGNPEPDPAAGWAWVTGEPWSFTAWYFEEPNDGGPGNTTYAEDFLHYYYGSGWNDVYNEWGVGSYIVEYEPRRQRDESDRPSPPRIGAGLSGLFNGQPTPLPTAPAPAGVAPSTNPVISPPRTGDAGLK